MLIQRARVNLILLALLVAAAASVSSDKHNNARPRSGHSIPLHFGTDGDEEEMNCPSMNHQLTKVSSVRCEACRALTDHLRRRVFDEHEASIDDVVEGVCDFALAHVELRQWRTGFKFWELPTPRQRAGKDKAAALEPTATSKRRTEDGKDAPKTELRLTSDDVTMNVTYTTRDEAQTLPCAAFLFKRFCESFLGDFGDDVAECFGGGDRRSADDVSQCLRVTVCEKTSRECDARALGVARAHERKSFLMYQAAFGPTNFQYVADEKDPNTLVRNPYAKGQPLEGNKEYVRYLADTKLSNDDL